MSFTFYKKAGILYMLTIFFSCASVPTDTIILSQKLGEDLQSMKQAHFNIVNLHFTDVKRNINSFIDETYTPFIINYVLNEELTAYRQNQTSIFLTLDKAAKSTDKENSDSIITEMQNFLSAAKKQIEVRRKELVDPVDQQHQEVIAALEVSYTNMFNTNYVITNYLQSLRKLKDTQSDALSRAGLAGADMMVTKNLSKLSLQINELVQKGKNIDVKSAEAYEKIEEISKGIKSLIK